MKLFSFVVLAITAVTAENLCAPGSTFKQNCNTCICSKDGRAAACTDMACSEEMTNEIDSTPSERYCEPGKRFQIGDCSTCICSADGTKAKCTLALCQAQRNIFTKNSRQKFCTPGTTFSQDDCNICKCNEDGTSAMCTLTQCPSKKITLPAQPEEVCKPYSVFKDYCNTCVCADDGSGFACTRMFCDKEMWNKDGSLKVATKTQDVKVASEKQVCQPRTTFKDYCNTCFCDVEGLSFSCTRMYCDKEIWNKDGSLKVAAKSENIKVASEKQVCQPRSTFKDYCNTCVCADDGSGFACTRMFCDKEIWNKDGSLKVAAKSQNIKVASEKVCQPRTTFKDYCNTCFCDVEGLSFSCTRMYCNKEIWNKDGSLKVAAKDSHQVCTPNSHFKESCNTCVCSNDGLSKACTMMTCNGNLWNKDSTTKMTLQSLHSGIERVCEPGKAYSPDGCNTCICSADGMNAACTMKLCLRTLKPVYAAEREKWGRKYSQGDACVPGKAFYSECNQCVCSTSGKSAFCTLMDCRARA